MKTLFCIFIFGIALQSCNQRKWVKLEPSQSIEQFGMLQKTAINNQMLIVDEEMAVNIAEIYLFSVYGKSMIKSERPYQIGRIKNYWVVVGSCEQKKYGGFFKIEINAFNGAVVKITHEE